MERNSSEIIKKLKENGWELVRIRGSHNQFKHKNFPNLITVPHPKKDLPTGTVKKILKEAGLI